MGKRKRRWIIVCAGACVLIAAAFAIMAVKPNRYAFLDRFNPRRVVCPGAFVGPPGSPMIMLVFPQSEANRVFAAMRNEMASSVKLKPWEDTWHKGIWVFGENRTVSPRDPNKLVFASGPSTSRYEYELEHGIMRLAIASVPERDLPPPCCIVLLPKERPTWFQTRWTNLRSFSHI